MKFYLGTHQPHWLGLIDVPLFVSRSTLKKRKTFPRALGRWALDSGGFTELGKHGGWSITARQYVEEVRRFSTEIGGMDWAAPQDWMCEPIMLEKTGLTVSDHQRNTTENYLELMTLAPEIPWAPVLQGWASDDYMRHVDAYSAAGVDLTKQKIVGVGSVCRRGHTAEIVELAWRFKQIGIKCHGFGIKRGAIKAGGSLFTSADSLAWSAAARWAPPLDGCETHKNCANCIRFALKWRLETLAMLPKQKEFWS